MPCFHCGNSASHTCSKCKHAMYCSTQCQSENWNTHALFCGDLEEIKKMPMPKKKSIGVRIQLYKDEMNDLHEKLVNQTPLHDIVQKYKNLSRDEYMKVIPSIVTNTYKEQAKISSKMNYLTTKITKEILREKSKATEQQIEFVESQLIKYGKAINDLHVNFENVPPNIFNNITQYYRNAWVTVHAILGVNESEFQNQESKILSSFAAETMLQTAASMIKGMRSDNKVEPVDGIFTDFANVLKYGASDTLRALAECLMQNKEPLGSVREAKPADAKRRYNKTKKDLNDHLEHSKNFGSKFVSTGLFISEIADEIERTVEDDEQKYYSLQLVLAGALTLFLGYRYTLGFTSQQSQYEIIEDIYKQNVTKEEITVENTRLYLKGTLELMEKRETELIVSFNATDQNRTQFLLNHIIPSEHILATYLSTKLKEAGIEPPANLNLIDSSEIPVSADNYKNFENATELQRVYPLGADNATELQPPRNDTKFNVIDLHFRPLLTGLLKQANETLAGDKSYQSNAPGVQEVKKMHQDLVIKFTREYLDAADSSKMNPADYASTICVIASTFHHALQRMNKKLPGTDWKTASDILEEILVSRANLQGNLTMLQNRTKEVMLQMDNTKANFEEFNATRSKMMEGVKRQPGNPVTAFWNDLMFASTFFTSAAPSFMHGTHKYMKHFFDTNFNEAFKGLTGLFDALKKNGPVGILSIIPTIVTFSATNASEILKILLYIQLLARICEILLPALVAIFYGLRALFVALANKIGNWIDFEKYYEKLIDKFPTCGASFGVHFMYGTIRSLSKIVILSGSFMATSLTTVLPALFSLIVLMQNMLGFIIAAMSLLNTPWSSFTNMISHTFSIVSSLYMTVTFGKFLWPNLIGHRPCLKAFNIIPAISFGIYTLTTTSAELLIHLGAILTATGGAIQFGGPILGSFSAAIALWIKNRN